MKQNEKNIVELEKIRTSLQKKLHYRICKKETFARFCTVTTKMEQRKIVQWIVVIPLIN